MVKIIKLKAKNFRNISQLNFEPSSGLNIFTGSNGQGKSNLLEAIFVLATGGSFRRGKDTNLVKYNEQGYTVAARYEIDGREIETEIRYSINGDKLNLVNKNKSNLYHRDRIRVVIFTPDDLFLIKGSPAKRRAFLDFILKQISNEYLYNFDNYTNILKKRNIFLKREQTAGKSYQIINDLFVENAIRLIIQRIQFVGVLEDICQPVYSQINQAKYEMKIKYALSFGVESDKINVDVLQTAMHQHIQQHKDEEIKRRKTLVGPHLDDLNVYSDGRPAQLYASQGQQRNLSISLKLGEMYAFHRMMGFYPVLLLDDVLSELDDSKKSMLMEYLRQADFQTFLTSVSIGENIYNDAAHYWIEEGRLERKE